MQRTHFGMFLTYCGVSVLAFVCSYLALSFVSEEFGRLRWIIAAAAGAAFLCAVRAARKEFLAWAAEYRGESGTLAGKEASQRPSDSDGPIQRL